MDVHALRSVTAGAKMSFPARIASLEQNGYDIIMYDKFFAAPLGSQIRALRAAKGWTLQTLADHAGTSAPTIHRYEGGWDRFEMGTLRKIAAALDARLLVQLVPVEPGRQAGPRSAGELVALLAPLFWDKPLTSADLERYPAWVLRRVLMFGNREHAAGVRAYFDDEAILDAVRHRSVDARTRRYWEILLGKDELASQSPEP
jgi:transcriptional regulator with XRE-family HTH domain